VANIGDINAQAFHKLDVLLTGISVRELKNHRIQFLSFPVIKTPNGAFRLKSRPCMGNPGKYLWFPDVYQRTLEFGRPLCIRMDSCAAPAKQLRDSPPGSQKLTILHSDLGIREIAELGL
jgi:hypothetical protein